MKLRKFITLSFLTAALTASAAATKETNILQNKQIIQNTNVSPYLHVSYVPSQLYT